LLPECVAKATRCVFRGESHASLGLSGGRGGEVFARSGTRGVSGLHRAATSRGSYYWRRSTAPWSSESLQIAYQRKVAPKPEPAEVGTSAGKEEFRHAGALFPFVLIKNTPAVPRGSR